MARVLYGGHGREGGVMTGGWKWLMWSGSQPHSGLEAGYVGVKICQTMPWPTTAMLALVGECLPMAHLNRLPLANSL